MEAMTPGLSALPVTTSKEQLRARRAEQEKSLKNRANVMDMNLRGAKISQGSFPSARLYSGASCFLKTGMGDDVGKKRVDAEVPLSEMFGFPTTLLIARTPAARRTR